MAKKEGHIIQMKCHGCGHKWTTEMVSKANVEEADFKRASRYRSPDTITGGSDEDNSCDQCNATMIQGVFTHERGCPNKDKVKLDGRWARSDEQDESTEGGPKPKVKVSVKRPIGHKISDIGPGGKEHNVKTKDWPKESLQGDPNCLGCGNPAASGDALNGYCPTCVDKYVGRETREDDPEVQVPGVWHQGRRWPQGQAPGGPDPALQRADYRQNAARFQKAHPDIET
jgi:hypothetical protein